MTLDTKRRIVFTVSLGALCLFFILATTGCHTPVPYKETTWDKVPPGTKVICWGRSWHGGDAFVRFPDGGRYVIRIDNGEPALDYRQRIEATPRRFRPGWINPILCLDHKGLGTRCTRCWRPL